MGAALDATVHEDVDLITHCIDNLCKLVERAARAVELPPTMIGHHDTGAADVDCSFGKSWPGESAQIDKWIFCLTAA